MFFLASAFFFNQHTLQTHALVESHLTKPPLKKGVKCVVTFCIREKQKDIAAVKRCCIIRNFAHCNMLTCTCQCSYLYVYIEYFTYFCYLCTSHSAHELVLLEHGRRHVRGTLAWINTRNTAVVQELEMCTHTQAYNTAYLYTLMHTRPLIRKCTCVFTCTLQTYTRTMRTHSYHYAQSCTRVQLMCNHSYTFQRERKTTAK